MRVVTTSVMAVVLVLASTASASAQVVGQAEPRRAVPVPAPAPGPRTGTIAGPHLMGFSVVLVQGDMRGGGEVAGVPPAAAKALTDLKEFLPYRSYQLLDTQWTMGQDRVVSRLQGGGRVYELEMNARQVMPASVSVAKFVLKEVGSASTLGRGQEQDMAGLEQMTKLRLRLADLEVRRQVTQTREEKGLISMQDAANERRENFSAVAQVTVELARLQQALERSASPGMSGTVIDSSFRMDLGETVVVGTSRLQGDRALIVLLTAVAR